MYLMNKTNLYRALIVVLLAVLSLGVLSGCAAGLPEGFDQAEVDTAAKNVIDLLDRRDSDGLSAILSDDMKVGLTEDLRAQIFAYLDGAGAVKEIKQLKSAGSEENGITFVVVVASVQHENTDITYTISFDKDMKLAGLYLK